MPPMDCQTWRPRSMSARVYRVVPVDVTTRSGIGGAARKISPPAQSRTENETTSRMPRPIHNLRVMLMAISFETLASCDPHGRRTLTQVKRSRRRIFLRAARAGQCGESLAQNGRRQGFQGGTIDQFQFAAIHLQPTLGLEAPQHAADGFRCEPQVIGDVGTRHR